MARKKPEAMVALDRVSHGQVKCADCEEPAFIRDQGANLCEVHYVARAQSEAMRNMPDELVRQPGETTAEWRKRSLKWLREGAKQIAEKA